MNHIASNNNGTTSGDVHTPSRKIQVGSVLDCNQKKEWNPSTRHLLDVVSKAVVPVPKLSLGRRLTPQDGDCL